jgi:DNA-binding HxlR family transcriptional regulator
MKLDHFRFPAIRINYSYAGKFIGTCLPASSFPAFRSVAGSRGLCGITVVLSRKRLKDASGIGEVEGRKPCFLPPAMYEKKLPFDIDCGIRIAMEVIGGKWKSCIIFELAEGPKRPSELHRLFPEANSRVIDQQLKELETCGIIEKKIYARLPPHSEYSITPAGKTLIPVVRQLEQWGNEFRPAMKKILGMEDGR